MKGLRATESHSADRAAKQKWKENLAGELKNNEKLDFFEFSKRFDEKS